MAYCKSIVWTPGKWERASEMLDQGFTRPVVAEDVGVTVDQLDHKINNVKSSGRHLRLHPKIDPKLVAARDRRAQASNDRGLTATLFGDPPLGYSALDRLGPGK